MFDNLEKPFNESLVNSLIEIKKNNIFTLTSSSLILAFVKYKDSLFSELYPEILSGDVLNIIKMLKEYNEDLNMILQEALKLSKASGYDEIYDEYIFYVIVYTKCDALEVLKKLNIDIDSLKGNLNNYIKEESNFLTNITKEAINKKIKPYIGRKYYIEKVIRIISKKEKNNCLLIGSAGVGKSALVEGVAMHLVNINSPYVIYRLDIGAVVAGTRYRGDLEERLEEVINKVKNPNTILFIDEIHTIINGGSSEGSLDIASILKPALARSEIKCIGATTVNEYYKYIEKDEALARRFQKIFIPQANEKETLSILLGIKKEYEKYYNVSYNKDIIKTIIKKSQFYVNRYFPDKAIDILDEAGALAFKKKKTEVTNSEIKQIVFENLGIINYKKTAEKYKSLNFKQLIKYYKLFFLNLNVKKNILNIVINEDGFPKIIEDLNNIFNLTNENIYKVTNIYDDYDEVCDHVMKFPISIICLNYEKNIVESFINKYINEENNRKVSFKNTIIIFKLNIKNKRINPLGFSNKEDLFISDKKFIDEIICDFKERELIDNLISSFKDSIIIQTSNDITDSDYDEVLKKIIENISYKKILINKNYNNIICECFK